MKKTVKKLKFWKLKYNRKTPRKWKFFLGVGVIALCLMLFLTFLQSSFFFCRILLPSICKVYNLEISADKIDVSLLDSDFYMHNIIVRDNQNQNELFIDQIDGTFHKWRIFNKEYYFKTLHIGKINLKFIKSPNADNTKNNNENKEPVVFNNDLLENISQEAIKIIQLDYLQERFPDLIIDDLDIDNFNIQISYGKPDNPGEIVISNLELKLEKSLNSQINADANGNLKIREPYSQIEKNGSLSWRALLTQKEDRYQYYLKSKISVDFPETNENFICDLVHNTTDKTNGNYGNILFKSFKEEKLTSSVNIDTFWLNKYNFHLKLHEVFVAPEVLRFASELIYGKSFGIFDGRLSGILLSNQDEFIFNFYAKLNRKADKYLDKLEFIADIASRYNRGQSQLMVSSCYAGLTLGEHKLLTLTTPEKYIYNIENKTELSNFKFDINVDKFDMKIVDYFCMEDSSMRFIDGLISADINSEVVLKDKKVNSQIIGQIDKLKSTLYNDDYFEFNGYFDLLTNFDYDNFLLTAKSNKVTFVNNLQDNSFIADATGEGWVNFKNLTCDFQIDIFNGNEKVFTTFDWTKQYFKDLRYLDNYVYSLSCRTAVLNDQTFDLLNSCFTVKDKSNNIILQATASPIELEIKTECETNLNPINIQIVAQDSFNEILGYYYPNLKKMSSSANCLMSFGKEFRNWEIKSLNWQIFPEADNKNAVFEANANFFMDFDKSNETSINIYLDKINESFIERLLKYDFCNQFIGKGNIGIKLFNDFENSEIRSNINLENIKFLSHPENIFSAELQSLLTFNNSEIDRFENYFSGQIDGVQTVLTELHKSNKNGKTLKLEWVINYLDLLNIHNIFNAWKKTETLISTNKDAQEKTLATTTIENQKNLFDFKQNIEIDCDFDNITYGPKNTIKLEGFFDCFQNKIKSKDLTIEINNNKINSVIELLAIGDKITLDSNLQSEKIILPLIKTNEDNEGKSQKVVRGEINNFACNLQTVLNDDNTSLLDHLSGRVGGRIGKLIIPNNMTNSLLGNILVYSFEFAAKLIDLLPTKLSFLQGYINLVTKFNENRYYELVFDDGVFDLTCKNGVIEINELSLKGEAIDSFECSGKIGIGSKPFMDILSKAKINNIVFPLYFEGVLEDPEVNMVKSARAFMKNIFTIFQ